SEFSRDAKTPVKESYIPNILQEQFDEKDIIVIPLSFINGDEKKTQEFIRRNLKKGIKLFVCDVETEDDLKSIAQIFSNMKDKDIVWVGSGGLVEYLPEAIGINSSPNKSTKLKTSKPLIISGSLSKVTKLQLETLKKVKNPYVIEVNPVHLVKKTFNIDELLKLDINVDDFDLIILYVDSTEENRESIMRIREELKLSNTQISELIVGGLGQLGKSILERVPDIESLI